MIAQRNFTFGTFDQFQSPVVNARQPLHELHAVAHRGRQQQRFHLRRQQAQAKLPHDASFWIVKTVELVHDDGPDVAKIKRFSVQQSIE